MYDEPGALALISAVAAFLRDSVVPGTDGALRHQARVAANALDVAHRELLEAPGAGREHRRRLADLGLADDAELEALASTLPQGDPREDAVAACLGALAAAKLAVFNPEYAETDRSAPTRGAR